MKHSKFLLVALTALFFSCNNPNSGNKSAIPVDEPLLTPMGTGSSENTSTEAQPSNNQESLKHSLTFTAFKTPEKVGVNGTFNDIKLENVKNEGKLDARLESATFSIDANSVSTNDSGRDQKITTFFFAKMSEPKISGSFGKFENGKVPVKIKMNSKEKEISMNYTLTENEIILKGNIDIIKDFSGSDALKSINEACFDLHAGKTWSDVNLEVKISL